MKEFLRGYRDLIVFILGGLSMAVHLADGGLLGLLMIVVLYIIAKGIVYWLTLDS